MKTLEVIFKKESDRATLLGCLIAVGYVAKVDLKPNINIKEILDDTPFNVWPILLIQDQKKIGFRRSNYNSPKLTMNWPEDAASIIEYFNPSIVVKLTGDYDAIINKKDQVVEVGCQVIPFSKIEELHKIINS